MRVIQDETVSSLAVWSAVPDDRYNEEAFYHPDPDNPNGTTHHRGGHFVDAPLKNLDNAFFRLSPHQAAAMDPQQRFLLEVTYEALESAGIPREEYQGSDAGVFAASFIKDFDRNAYKDPAGQSAQTLLGSEDALVANRISYCFDLHDRAVRHRDPIRGVIRNTAANQDGYTAEGITYPNGKAQQALIRSCYAKIRLRPEDVAYVEAHGTGTIAGDYQELSAISSVFATPIRSSPLYVGSIKGNIGHTENTSGLAGLLKSMLMLEHSAIPPVVGHCTPKPGLVLDSIFIPTTLTSWPHKEGVIPRISINSFGFGGANAHAIIEGAPRPDESQHCANASPRLFHLSANCKESLLSMVSGYHGWLENNPEASLVDPSYTLCERRTAFPWRFARVAESHASLSRQLQEGLDGTHITPSNTNVAFVFTGQGAQWLGMGRELLIEKTPSSTFRDSIRISQTVLHELGATWDLQAELLGDDASLLNTAELAQPITTALQRPDVVLGHSSGEITAAYAAGFISQRAALTIAFHRGFMAAASRSKGLRPGSMLSVGLSEQDAAPYLGGLKQGIATIACVNSPRNVTVSGDAIAIDEVSARLSAEENKILHRRLVVDAAYHSHHMEAVADEYRSRLAGLEEAGMYSGSALFISSVTGTFKSTGFGPRYWVENLVSPVRFYGALKTLGQDFNSHLRNRHVFLLEVGPHSALAGPIRQSLADFNESRFEFFYGSVLQRKMDAVESTLCLAARLFEKGVTFSPAAVSSLTPGYHLAKTSTGLPASKWDHSSEHWHESQFTRQHRFRCHPYHDLLGARVVGSTTNEPQWRHMVCLNTLRWLAHHVIDGLMVFPGSGYICMTAEAILQLDADRHSSPSIDHIVFTDISFLRALVVPQSDRVELRLTLHNQATAQFQFKFSISSLSDNGWHENCNGLVQGLPGDQALRGLACPASRQVIDGSSVAVTDFYHELAASGNVYGPTFAAVQSFTYAEDETMAQASVKVPNVASLMPAHYQMPHLVHPTTLDAVLHTSLPLVRKRIGAGSIMPIHIDELFISRSKDVMHEPGSELEVTTRILSSHFRTAYTEASVASNSVPILSIFGAEVQRVSGNSEDHGLDTGATDSHSCYEVEWQPDLDHLRAEDMGQNPTLRELLGHISYKRPGLTIAAIESQDEPSLPLEEQAKNHTDAVESSLRADAYDVVLITSPGTMGYATSLLKRNGVLLAALPCQDSIGDMSSGASLKQQISVRDALLERFIVMMRPTGSAVESFSGGIQVLRHSAQTSSWATALIASLPSHGLQVCEFPKSPDEAAVMNSSRADTYTLVLEDQRQSVLSDPACFDAAMTLLRQSAKIVWVAPETELGVHQITGVVRSAHAEHDSLCVTTIHVASDTCLEPRFRQLVAFCIENAGAAQREREYLMLANGTIKVPRVRLHEESTRAINSLYSQTSETIHRPITDVSRPVKVFASSVRKPHDPCFVEMEETKNLPIASDDIQIQVQAMALSQTYRTSSFGEFTGVVVWTGTSVKAFVPGDRVLALGSYNAKLPTPALLLDAMAATYSVRELIRASKGDTVLVHGAATGTGRAAIALAQAAGARVLVTAADDKEAQRFYDQQGIGLDDVLWMQPSSTRLYLNHVLSGGLDSIIQATEDAVPAKILGHLKPFGCVAVLCPATRSKTTVTVPDRLPPNATLHHCDIEALLEARAGLIADLLPLAAAALSDTSLDGLDICVRDVAKTDEVLQLLDSGKYAKAVVQVTDSSAASAKVVKSSSLSNKEASYVVSGGLGDLGGRFLRILAQRGAKSLITFSRRDADPDEYAHLQSTLEAIQPGCRLHCIKCDVTSQNAVDEAGRLITFIGLPPVHGVIQSAAVISDHTLETMTYDDFVPVAKAKIDGTLSLYHAFGSSNLDFFIMLSSIAGVVGSSGRANYNAGNVVQDLIAQHERGGRCHFMSLDIGWVEDSHLTVDSETRENAVHRAGMKPIGPESLSRFFDYSLAASESDNYMSQAVIGIDPARLVKSVAQNGTIRSPMCCHVLPSPGNDEPLPAPAAQSFAQVAVNGDHDSIVDFIASSMSKRLPQLISIDPATIDRGRTSLLSQGLDSLVAIELRNWIARDFEAPLQSSEILIDQPAYALAEKVASRSRLVKQ
ncbi:hypothetical protein S7711_09508 [Stachybotrys chartarum IBT 7711]|uniref:Carrier domain-containing protein n=1 Tax=Stachybotrys chartarum (strain CBS 109288 / IBT 7711) TaxID=1280523 RepID=A0A084B5G0_STACB|nr:hypothetical protein S7711_09508 [Stachybotrys chartarum IBT 7711]